MSLAPISGGLCHCKKDSLSPVKHVDDSTDTVLFSYQNYDRQDLSMFLYKHLEDDPGPKELENGARIQRH